MRLRFEAPGDNDAYDQVRGVLLDELDGWWSGVDSDREAVVSDVAVFLDWRYFDSTGVLDDFAPADIAEFLLEWCPRRFEGRPDDAASLCFAVGVYVDFMEATGRLVGGADRAARLRRLADDLAPTLLAEARDPTVVEDLPDLGDAPEPFELPFLYVPPSATDLAAAATAVPLLAKLDALRDYLGPDGKPLTDKGELELADGRALVERLDTGDVLDFELGELKYPARSTAALRRLNFLVQVAIEAGAVDVHRHRVLPGQEWGTRSPVERAESLFAAILLSRPLRSLHSAQLYPEQHVMHDLLDDGIACWLAPLLQDGAKLPFESLLEWVHALVAAQRPSPRWYADEEDTLEAYVEDDMGRLLDVLRQAGVVRWTDALERPQPLGPSNWTGGTVALTALGRHVVPEYLEDAGFALRRLDRINDWDATDLIGAMLLVGKDTHVPLIANWRSDRPAAERVQMVTEAAAAMETAAGRTMGFVALNEFDIDVAEPFVRQLLDSPVAGHAAVWLIQRDRADAETLASFVDVAVLVDVLAESLESPEELCSLFAGLSDPSQLLDDIWRHPAPETALVLDALGRHLPDRALAKAARKAAVRHQSWMANRL
ncbi:hypothetical protein [Mycobacterium paraintracellulare]|uniref:hypothetical protein n=1 Tax=Mycobacterium paraintracellulare TaxID=1138383 RepID=UPI0019283645|nr:hypothetical protein [Mycobacterium paraintracellulare]BCO83906.1 hypothetical protein MINTM011_22410 [Mycobacterium paraintracellulare]BCP04796.1 hypothetical protein MINTM019_22520 [Mycobacterium paraintracellulare]